MDFISEKRNVPFSSPVEQQNVTDIFKKGLVKINFTQRHKGEHLLYNSGFSQVNLNHNASILARENSLFLSVLFRSKFELNK